MTEPLVLASRSPRRRELLQMLGIAHDVSPAEIDETRRPDEAPVAYAQRVARDKAEAESRRHPGRWVLGADTTVVLESAVLGKPESPAAAVAMLERLAGRRHEVVTAIALVRDGTVFEAHDVTAVWMRALDAGTIHAYVATEEPLDKAGAYGIQGFGAVLVDRIEGDYFSVMGLPVRLVAELMARAGRPYVFTA